VSTYTVTLHSTTLVTSSTVTTPASTSTVQSSSTITTSTTTTSTTTASTSHSLTPPVRPTTDSQTTVTAMTTASASASSPSVCPTGFYACSAVYQGGCCRVGRNCDTTSCPAPSSTIVVNSGGVTIVVPASTSTAGSCASGWSGCAASLGGGCCPSGFLCGSSCTASVSGTATTTVAKSQPGNGAAGRNKQDLYRLGSCVLGALCFLL
jgi:hypothetical protein